MSYRSITQVENAGISRTRSLVQKGFGRGLGFVQARLSPEGRFGRRVSIGALTFLGASWLFLGIAEDVVTGDPLVLVDQRISEWLRTHGSGVLATGMQFASALASITAVSVLAVAAGSVFLWKRRWYSMLELVLVVAGGMLLNVLLKGMFGRPRPGWADPSLVLVDPGFPSGHTMMATVLFGFVAIHLVVEIASRRWRILVVTVTLLLVLLVALSRMYLGAHYLSDVLAAMAAGAAWIACCITAVESFRRNRAAVAQTAKGAFLPAKQQRDSR